MCEWAIEAEEDGSWTLRSLLGEERHEETTRKKEILEAEE
jgi:hypothetical protein